MEEVPDVCVVTQPVSPATTPHVESMIAIFQALTQVCLVTPNYPNDGDLRHEIEVFDVADVGTGTAVPVVAWRFVRNQVRMARIIQQRDEDIVWFFGATSYILPMVGAKLAGKTVVIHPRGNVPLSLRLHWEERLPSSIARLLAGSISTLESITYRLADAIVTYTSGMAMELGLTRYGEKLYSDGARFIDTDRFCVSVRYQDRETVVGYVGRFDPEKRLPVLADTAKALAEEVEFLFVGDGVYRQTLEAKLRDEIEAGSVTITGWIDREDLPKQYNRCQLVVVPSHATEGLPTVLLEAMACGTPALATPVASVTDLIEDGETGYLLDDERALSLSEQIEEILSSPNRHQVSEAAREHVVQHYRFEAAVDRYRAILTSV